MEHYHDSLDVSLKDDDQAASLNNSKRTSIETTDVEKNPTTSPDNNFSSSKYSPSEPLDGGLIAWLQVVSTFFVLFNTLGNAQSFGTYQTYYESGELFQASSSAIAWIGSMQTFLMHFVGALTGPLYDAGYFNHLIITGPLFIVFGTMMLSVCTEHWQAILSQGICIGIGQGMAFVPSVSALACHFRKKLGMVNGLASIGSTSIGSSIGAIVMTIVFHQLQPRIGFPWTVRIIGFIQFGTLLVAIGTMRGGQTSEIVRSAFRQVGWVIYVVGFVVGIMGIFVPFYYVQYFSIHTRISGLEFSFYLLAIMNASAIIGRVIPGLVADGIGPLNTVIPCVWISALLILCLMAVKGVAGLVVVAIFYGIFQAPFLALYAPAVVAMTPTLQVVGTRMGMTLGLAGIGQLIGPPSAGAILGTNNFTNLWLSGGICCFTSGCLYTVVRIVNNGWPIWKRA